MREHLQLLCPKASERQQEHCRRDTSRQGKDNEERKGRQRSSRGLLFDFARFPPRVILSCAPTQVGRICLNSRGERASRCCAPARGFFACSQVLAAWTDRDLRLDDGESLGDVLRYDAARSAACQLPRARAPASPGRAVSGPQIRKANGAAQQCRDMQQAKCWNCCGASHYLLLTEGVAIGQHCRSAGQDDEICSTNDQLLCHVFARPAKTCR